MEFDISISDVIAAIALLLSGYAIWTTSRFNKRQVSLIESQERLNSLLLEQGQSEVQDARRADLGASFVKLGSGNHRLKVFNKGKSPARDVRIEFPEGQDVFIESDIKSKFPMEVLERHQSVELIAAVSMGSKRKHTIKLMWADDASDQNEKIVYPTI